MDTPVVQGKNELKVSTSDKRNDVEYIQDQFNIRGTVEGLHKMMTEVTKEGFDAKNVNAACHCVSQLNAVINTTINAARFLREH